LCVVGLSVRNGNLTILKLLNWITPYETCCINHGLEYRHALDNAVLRTIRGMHDSSECWNIVEGNTEYNETEMRRSIIQTERGRTRIFSAIGRLSFSNLRYSIPLGPPPPGPLLHLLATVLRSDRGPLGTWLIRCIWDVLASLGENVRVN